MVDIILAEWYNNYVLLCRLNLIVEQYDLVKRSARTDKTASVDEVWGLSKLSADAPRQSMSKVCGDKASE